MLRAIAGVGWVCLAVATAAPAQETPKLRVSVTLVQVDAVVTDRQGRPVRDLKKDDFELFEDGKVREITHFSRFESGFAAQTMAQNGVAAVSPAAPGRDSVRRTVALVVDDLRMSFRSIETTRQTLHRFVDTQMEPGDMVAIVTTSGGSGALNRFTTDRQMLHTAISRIHFFMNGLNAAGALRALGLGEQADSADPASVAARYARGSINAMRYAIAGMRQMPGRKSLVLFSEGFAVSDAKSSSAVLRAALHDLAGGANQGAVVIYGIDPRGLVYTGLQAADDVREMESSDVNVALAARGNELRSSQRGLAGLAEATGGLALLDNNDFNGGLQRMMDDQANYYLLGFQANEQASERMRREGVTHRLELRVRRAGLRVRYRKQYLGEYEKPAETPPQTPVARLAAALGSPFAGSAIPLRLTTDYEFNERNQPSIGALVHIDGRRLTFGVPDASDYCAAKIQLAAITEGETGIGADVASWNYTIRVRSGALERIRQEGFVYGFQRVLKKSGAYYLRVAVLDEASGEVGSASRFVEVPDLKKGVLMLSAISMRDGDWRAGRHATGEEQAYDLSSATRVFHRDRPFSYVVKVLNARLDPRTGQPAVTVKARLLHEGRLVWEGQPAVVMLPAGAHPRSIPTGNVLTLGDKSVPGEYLLELQAVDPRAKGPAPSQWIDFELR